MTVFKRLLQIPPCLLFPSLAHAAVDAATLDRLCSDRGALDYAWGQAEVPFGKHFRSFMEPPLTLAEPVGGFIRAQPISTEWSDRFYAIDYHMPVSGKSAAAKEALTIEGLLEAADWRRDGDFAGEPVEAMLEAGGASWARPQGQVRLNLSFMFGALVLSCEHTELMGAQLEEAFGKLPPATPRPEMPRLQGPEAVQRYECAAETGQAAADAALVDGGLARIFARTFDAARFSQRLTTWKRWKLEQSGKVSADRLDGLMMQSMDYDGSLQSLQLLVELMPVLERMDAAHRAGDRKQVCLGLNDLNAMLGRIAANVGKSGSAIERMLDAEAARVGVSFD